MSIERMIRKYNTQLDNDKFYNLEEKNKFLKDINYQSFQKKE